MKKPYVLFSTDGRGNWNRREWVPQCNKKVFLGTRCQGIFGHKGVHWNFNPSGSFQWDDNEEDSTENGCSGTTPPGAEGYKTPLEMQSQYYMNNFKDSDVTDPDEIARLERGEMNKNETIDRPVTIKEN